MAKFAIGNLKNNEEYKKIILRILVSILIIVPYIVLFFFLENYHLVDRDKWNATTMSIEEKWIPENENLKAENQRLRQEIERLKATAKEQNILLPEE